MADVARRGRLEFTETADEVAFEVRAHEGALWTGGRLLIGIWAFAFAALAFAYFYLRSANNEQLFRPAHVTAPTGVGATIMAMTLGAGVLCIFGYRRLKAGQRLDWVVASWTAVLLAVVVVGLQIFELTRLPFFPGSSGYASCFVGWAPMNVALVLSAAYWLETGLARDARLRREALHDPAMQAAADQGAQMRRISSGGCAYFFGFVAFVGVFFWVVFYVL